MNEQPSGGRSRWSAVLVGSGILLSRLAGLARERVLAHYFGVSLYSDVFRAVLRLPNVLQNLLGEGTLSASFIPVYSELLEEGKPEEAGRMAGAVFALLVALVSGLTLLGILAAPLIVKLFVYGFSAEHQALAVPCTRIIFAMTGTLVLSAWALGILNSHRKFFLPYVAPVLWNAAMIATLLLFGDRLTSDRLLIALAWGALLGGLLQLVIQLPWVLRYERRLKIRWDLAATGVRETMKNAVPAILGRGVVQLGGYVDLFLGSFLATGALAALGYAQTLFLVPVSLFGMSVAAAELPELARQRHQAVAALQQRVRSGLRRIAFLVVPSAVAYLVLGDLLVAALYQTGGFSAADTRLVHLVLAGYALGLIAATSTRLLASAFFALHDTRTPAKIALVRVVLAAMLAVLLMTRLDQVQVSGKPLGALGLSLAAGLMAWLEWVLLHRRLRARIGPIGIGASVAGRLLVAAVAGAAAARACASLVTGQHVVLVAGVAVAAFGCVYLPLTHLLGLDEAAATLRQLKARLR